MKKHKKWFLTAGILIAAGIIICGITLIISGFDISSFSTVKVRTKKEISRPMGEEINLNVKTSDSDIIVKKSNDEQIKVTYYENDYITYDFLNDEGTFYITETDNRRWYEYLQISIGIQYNPLTVEIPNNAWENISINTSSGDIYFSEIDCEKLETKSSSGEVKVNNINARSEFSVNTSSGDIELLNMSTGKLSVENSSGETEISGVNTSSDMKIKSSSGDISVKECGLSYQLIIDTSSGETELSDIAANNMTINSKSGDVEFSRTDAFDYKIKTSSGNVEGTIKGDENTFSFDTDTSSGDISVPSQSSGDRLFTAKTSSGDIEIAFSS